MKIRSVHLDDVDDILEIYNPIVESSHTSFETNPPSKEVFAKRIEKNLETHPWLVVELSNKVIGYAYASPHRSREAYQWSAEVSVYVHSNFYKKGFAKKLYTELFKLLKRQGFVNLYAGIALPNNPSINLHESLGFEHIGVYKNIGFKLDQWWSVGWWQLELQKLEAPPPPTLSKNINL